MHEHPAIAFQLLHDETFAAEQAGHHLALEVHADLHPARAGQEAVLLADQLAAELVQLHRDHRARVGRSEGDLGLALAGMGVDRGKQRFAGDHPLAGRQQLVHETATLAFVAAIAEHGVHLHRGVLEHQRAGFGDRAFARVQLDLDELHFLAVDGEIDVVVAAAGCGMVAAWHGGWRYRWHPRHRRRPTGRGQVRHLRQRHPAAHPGTPDLGMRVLRRVLARAGVIERAKTVGLAGNMKVPSAHRSALCCRERCTV